MIIGIDPGISGGLAVVGGGISVHKMPETPKDIYDMLKGFKANSDGDIKCYLEKVGTYMPGNSGPSAAKFARHCGNLEMALIALQIKYYEVPPAKWQKYLIGAPSYPKIPKEIPAKERKRILAKRKTERKNKIKQTVQARYPSLNITLATSDALGILEWGLNASRPKNKT